MTVVFAWRGGLGKGLRRGREARLSEAAPAGIDDRLEPLREAVTEAERGRVALPDRPRPPGGGSGENGCVGDRRTLILVRWGGLPSRSGLGRARSIVTMGDSEPTGRG